MPIETYLSAERIAARITELAAEIAAELPPEVATEGLVVLGPLKGAVVFLADLIRALHPHVPHVEIDFIGLASYGKGTESSGTVTLDSEPRHSLTGRHVLLIDDIIDSGRTLAFGRDWVLEREPASLRLATLLDKPARREVEVEVAHVGFAIDDVFVVGFGTDWAERYRELPYLGVVVD